MVVEVSMVSASIAHVPVKKKVSNSRTEHLFLVLCSTPLFMDYNEKPTGSLVEILQSCKPDILKIIYSLFVAINSYLLTWPVARSIASAVWQPCNRTMVIELHDDAVAVRRVCSIQFLCWSLCSFAEFSSEPYLFFVINGTNLPKQKKKYRPDRRSPRLIGD